MEEARKRKGIPRALDVPNRDDGAKLRDASRPDAIENEIRALRGFDDDPDPAR